VWPNDDDNPVPDPNSAPVSLERVSKVGFEMAWLQACHTRRPQYERF
jgi:hypothetical protein